MRWPGVVPPGRVTGTPVSSPDFFATLMEAAGAPLLSCQTLDGTSLLPVFKGGELPERALFWHYPDYGNQGGAPAAASRHGVSGLPQPGNRSGYSASGSGFNPSKTNPGRPAARAAAKSTRKVACQSLSASGSTRTWSICHD